MYPFIDTFSDVRSVIEKNSFHWWRIVGSHHRSSLSLCGEENVKKDPADHHSADPFQNDEKWSSFFSIERRCNCAKLGMHAVRPQWPHLSTEESIDEHFISRNREGVLVEHTPRVIPAVRTKADPAWCSLDLFQFCTSAFKQRVFCLLLEFKSGIFLFSLGNLVFDLLRLKWTYTGKHLSFKLLEFSENDHIGFSLLECFTSTRLSVLFSLVLRIVHWRAWLFPGDDECTCCKIELINFFGVSLKNF